MAEEDVYGSVFHDTRAVIASLYRHARRLAPLVRL
eukprot:CAMPEP_0170477178 /NCGR_PEP_ID=MMETSP0123-20130129/18490_1 /TAXON_ID=182087 /ORGANISM="Favella ehrenbergii, Strain Fehren 1" /LENGTH=34 /DNA_ID= /DNA_START= /DNA_END= /DNA_ORIENTATION=